MGTIFEECRAKWEARRKELNERATEIREDTSYALNSLRIELMLLKDRLREIYENK